VDIPAAKVRKLRKIMQEPISLEAPIGKQGDCQLSAFIEDRSVVSPAQAAINVNLKKQTAHVLHTLSAREEKVLWSGGRPGAHAGGGWPVFSCHSRAHPPDRSPSAAQVAPP
jgi:hypothetical protein